MPRASAPTLLTPTAAVQHFDECGLMRCVVVVQYQTEKRQTEGHTRRGTGHLNLNKCFLIPGTVINI